MENKQNSGSFGAGMLGDTSALRQAMQRRGLDTSILDNVSASAPTGPSNVSPDIPETNPQIGVEQSVASQAPGNTKNNAPAPRSYEMSVALDALAGTVKTENEIAKSANKLKSLGLG